MERPNAVGKSELIRIVVDDEPDSDLHPLSGSTLVLKLSRTIKYRRADFLARAIGIVVRSSHNLHGGPADKAIAGITDHSDQCAKKALQLGSAVFVSESFQSDGWARATTEYCAMDFLLKLVHRAPLVGAGEGCSAQ